MTKWMVTPGGIAPHLTKRSREGVERKKTKKKHVVLFTDAIHRLRGFCLESLIFSLWLLGWKSEGGACGGGREGGLSQKTFLIAFGLKRIS